MEHSTGDLVAGAIGTLVVVAVTFHALGFHELIARLAG